LLMIYYGVWPGWHLFALPVFTLLALGASVGAGLWLAALNVKYRDFRFVVPFLVQFGLYVSPVGFTSAIIPQKWRVLYSLNPMVGVIDCFRWSISGGRSAIFVPGLAIGCVVMLLLLVSGIWYFRRMERSFADII
jgi:lipopolysaccharide transport system permease protein